ncbi:MAG: hypothetical protein JWO77_3474 [Ilumatobacteraceae bacterium]|nr:hypothetical protein [Ilumatobacteraceae bacterium]
MTTLKGFITGFLLVVAAGAATVASAAGPGTDPAPSRGTIPEQAFRADGSLDVSLVPDLVSVEDDHGDVMGYARSADVASQRSAPTSAVDVWDASGKRLVGHVYPDGVGFLSIADEHARNVDPHDPPESGYAPTTVVG